MAGHLVLVQRIGVRIPIPEPKKNDHLLVVVFLLGGYIWGSDERGVGRTIGLPLAENTKNRGFLEVSSANARNPYPRTIIKTPTNWCFYYSLLIVEIIISLESHRAF
jgi:hypothetical protein